LNGIVDNPDIYDVLGFFKAEFGHPIARKNPAIHTIQPGKTMGWYCCKEIKSAKIKVDLFLMQEAGGY
jgi:hypothetical protein